MDKRFRCYYRGHDRAANRHSLEVCASVGWNEENRAAAIALLEGLELGQRAKDDDGDYWEREA